MEGRNKMTPKEFFLRMKERNWIVICENCNRALYQYEGLKDWEALRWQRIESKYFIPVTDDIPAPQPFEKANCPLCDHELFYVPTYHDYFEGRRKT